MWTETDQATAISQAASFAAQYQTAHDAWITAIQSGQNTVGAKGAVDKVVTDWQSFVNDLEQRSDTIMSDQNSMDRLGQVATQLAEERATLARLRNEAGTRSDQADSVNPKIRGSPYTNILGLRRTFRESTRFGILIASIVFGVLALCGLGFLGYGAVMKVKDAVVPQTGGSSSRANPLNLARVR
jgi:hypothetical protein